MQTTYSMPLPQEYDLAETLTALGWPPEWADPMGTLDPDDRRELIANMREYACGGNGYTTRHMTERAATLFDAYKPVLTRLWIATGCHH